MTAVVSLIIILIIIGLMEWADPAFKSERQVARYLDLSIIGSLPDLQKISRALAEGSAIHTRQPFQN
jgi:capsular polysaccharide biosynthesis protein